MRRIERALALLIALALMLAMVGAGLALADENPTAEGQSAEAISGDGTGNGDAGNDNVGDGTGGDNTGGDNTGGDDTGGDDTGVDDTGNDNTGGDGTGGDDTGNDNTGNDNTGGDDTGNDNTGNGDAGSDNTGDNAGDDTGNDNGGGSGDDNSSGEPENPDEPPAGDAPVEEAPIASLSLAMTSPEGMGGGGSYAIPLSARVGSLKFKWSCTVDCDGYAVAITGPGGASVLNNRQSGESVELSLSGLAMGRYTVSVAALQGDATIAQAKVTFELIDDTAQEGTPEEGAPEEGAPQEGAPEEGAPQEGTPEEGAPEEGAPQEGTPEEGAPEEGVPQEGTPEEGAPEEGAPQEGMPSGGFPGGGFPSGMRASFGGAAGLQGGAGEAEQGFHVTAGTALTSAHNAGDKDMSPYGSLALSWDEAQAMTALTLDGTALDIGLSDGGEFTATLDGATLALCPTGDAQAWTLNGYALKTLARSGVDALLLSLDGETISFPTTPALTGDAYGALCASGYVSADYDYTISPDGVEVRVDDTTWRLSEDGELSTMGG